MYNIFSNISNIRRAFIKNVEYTSQGRCYNNYVDNTKFSTMYFHLYNVQSNRT